MNTKSLLTRIAVPVLSLGLLGGTGLALATSAGAATMPAVTMASVTHAVTVRGLTFQQHVEDTTSTPPNYTTGALIQDPTYGPVWAYDDMARTAVATQDPGDSTLWHVTLNSDGLYHGFANPITGQAQAHTGVVAGWVTYDVRSSVAPSQRNLPFTEPSADRSYDILNAFFGGNLPAGAVTSLHYSFSYYGLNNATGDVQPGAVYTQVG